MIDEDNCILRIKQGRADQYRLLVERYQVGLIIHCENILRSRHDGEDIAQEAFIKAYKNIATYSPERGRFSTWLYYIATNLCIDYLRKNKPKQDIKDLEVYLEAPQPATALEQDDVLSIRRAIEALQPPKYAEIIKAYFWEGKSYKDLASEHDTTTNTIGTWMRRAKEKLREELA